MAFRGAEGPMDFEWAGHGPVDPNSPFHKFAMENKKRSHAQFESPQKPIPQELRKPDGKPWYFSNPPTAVETSPYRAPSFTTPRKPFDIDFSSGPESSPAELPDNEDTPDGKPLPPLPIEFNSEPGTKRNSLFGMYGKFAPSPGRGEIKRPGNDAIARRIHKKRRKAQNFEKQIALARRSSDESSDEEPHHSPNKSRRQRIEEVGWMTGLFTFIHKYPDAPQIIAKYLQVFFNAAILGSCLYMFWSFYATIRADVDRASDEAMAEVLSEMAVCSKNYVENRCGADSRLPALETICGNWELCMNRDPSAVKRARLSAHTFAEILNSFVEPISLKTVVFTVVFVVLALFVNNATFTMYRRSQEQHPVDGYRHSSAQFMHPPQHPTQMNYYPSTPGISHGPSQQLEWHENESYGRQERLEYQMSPSKEKRGRSKSPQKKSYTGLRS